MKSQKTNFFSRKFNAEIIAHKRIKTIMRENLYGSSRLFRPQRPTNNKFPGFNLYGQIVVISLQSCFHIFNNIAYGFGIEELPLEFFKFLNTCCLGGGGRYTYIPTCNRRYCLCRGVQTFM